MNWMVLPNQVCLIVKLYNNRPGLLPDSNDKFRVASIQILFDCIPVQELLAAVLDPFALELRRTMCEGELNLQTPLYRPPPDLWLYRDYPR